MKEKIKEILRAVPIAGKTYPEYIEALADNLIIRGELRPCVVNGRNARFHRWIDRSEIIEPALARGGHSGGVMAWTVAIIEYEDGQLAEVLPSRIKFIDVATKDTRAAENKREAEE